MMRIRRADERGHADHGWLDTRHTFSFADYHDSRYMGFRAIRVINDDRVAPGAGFPTHPHRDMEIISYVVEGALEHRDSMGNGSVIRAGDVQRMSAGTGVTHSEFNPSPTEGTRFLQIWIEPERRGLEPGYEQMHFSTEDRRGCLKLVVSPDGRDGSLTVHRDVWIYAGLLDPGQTVTHEIGTGRGAWIQMVGGRVRVDHEGLRAGDGASLEGETTVRITGDESAEFLLLDAA